MSLRINRPTAFEDVPSVVMFDTDNTLYNTDAAHEKATAAAEQKACKLLGATTQEFRGAFTEARSRVKGQLGTTASSHSRLLYFQSTIEILGMRSQLLMTLDIEQTYWRAFLNASVLYPDVRDFILDLRGAGIRTAVITDLTARIQFRKLIYFGLDEVFDFVVTSEEAGADKPARAPFEIALRKLGEAPERCWMIGDNIDTDIEGARAFNITAVQKRHAGAVPYANADGAFSEFREIRNFFAQRKWVKQGFDFENV